MVCPEQLEVLETEEIQGRMEHQDLAVPLVPVGTRVCKARLEDKGPRVLLVSLDSLEHEVKRKGKKSFEFSATGPYRSC